MDRTDYLMLKQNLDVLGLLGFLFSTLMGVMLYDVPLKVRLICFLIVFFCIFAGWSIDRIELKKEYDGGK